MEEKEIIKVNLLLEKAERLQEDYKKYTLASVDGEPINDIKIMVNETNNILTKNGLSNITQIKENTIRSTGKPYIDTIALITKLSEIIASLNIFTNSVKKTSPRQINIFISHGPESSSLHKLARFVEAFGFNPIIVEHQASEGKTVSEQVEIKMKSSDCVIILATKDDIIDEKYHPRQNVIQEEGMATQILKGKIIYLLEEGCSFPSNISSRIWEFFTQDNMEKSFLKILREFKSFGFI